MHYSLRAQFQHRYFNEGHFGDGNHRSLEDFIKVIKSDQGKLLRQYWKDITRDTHDLPMEIYELDSERFIIFVSFPEPKTTIECYHIALICFHGNCRYLTLEKTGDITGDGTLSCLCEWNRGTHCNMGERKYGVLESFKSEVIRTYFPFPEKGRTSHWL